MTIALSEDVYAGWSLNSARERNTRARVITAAARIVDADPRYVAITFAPRPEDRRRYQLRATRRVVASAGRTPSGGQGQLVLLAGDPG